MAKAIDINRFLPPAARRLRKLTKQRTKAPADRRKRKRVSLEEINKFGAEALSSEAREEILKAPDKRGAFTKFLDVIDIPRNLVANAIAKLAGVKPKQQREGAILPKVFAADLLKAMRVKAGPARAILGFGLDVALDPLTYATAGATTGLRIAPGLPKILKGGTSSLRQTARAAIAGNLAGISDDVVRATGRSAQEIVGIGQRLIKRGVAPKKAIRRLMGRRGGIISNTIAQRAAGRQGAEAAKAARAFIAKFGEKGRTVLRVPFAKSGLTVPFGKRARQFKEIARGKLPRDVALGIGRAGRVGKGGALAVEQRRLGAAEAGVLKQIGVGKEAGKAQATAQLAQGARRQAQATGFTQRLLQRVGGGVPLSGGRATPKQVKELRRLTKQALKPAKVNQASVARTVQGQASKAATDALAEFDKINAAQKVLRQQGKMTMARIASDSARKKNLINVMASEHKALQARPVELAARSQRIAGIREKGAVALQRISADPKASPSIKGASEAIRGKLIPTQAQARLIHGKLPPGGGPREASLGRRFLTEAGRLKQRVFGGGPSLIGARAAGAQAQIRTGAPAARVAAQAAWAQKVEPLVQNLVSQTGQSADEIQKVLFRMVEAGAKNAKFVPEDPIIQVFAKFQPLLDDQAKTVLQEYGKQHAGILKEFDAAGVTPGALEDFLPRRATEQFQQIAQPEIRRTLVETGFNPSRVKELRWHDPNTGELLASAFTSPTKEAQARVKALTAQFGKPERFDISTMRFNSDPTIAKRLQPDLAAGRIQQFKESLPEAAGALAEQRVQRLALADIKGIAQGTGIPAQQLADQATRARFPGFAQVRWEQFDKTPAFQTIFKGLAAENQAYPQQVVDLLHRFMTLSAQPQEIRKILSWTDKSLSLWKGVTLAHPAYTIRNIFQNNVGNVMAGQRMGPYLAQARPGSRVHQITKAALSGQAVSGTLDVAGTQMSAQQFAKVLTDNNIIMSGMIGEALPAVGQAPGKFLRKLKPLQRWFALNSEIESTMKAASLWGFLDQGIPLQEALRKTALAMPDLADLTLFERNVARRLIPFYSWFRKNGAVQLFHYLPKKPAFIAAPAKIKQALEPALRGDNVVPEDLRPAWMQAMQAIQVSGDKEKGAVFLAASWLPFQELIKFGSGAFDIGEGARAVAEIGRPSLRFIAEQASGQDIFRRTPIEPTSPAGALKRLPEALIGRGPLGGVLGVRPLREAFRVAEVAEQGPAAAVGRAFVGGAFQPVSKVRGLGAEFQRLRDESIKLRQQINRALQVNDESLAESLKRQYLQVLLQMHQMGLPGVPKATQGVFQQAGLQPGPPAFEGR